MSFLLDTMGRAMLKPALRLMRMQMKLVSDPVLLRNAAKSVDALGRRPDARTERVTAGSAPATWVDVKGAHKDRVVLYLHGGAFVAETPLLHSALLARICTEAHARGLMLSYRLSPEHRYPAALDDCVAAYRWLLEQSIAPDNIVVAGDSAGGNLTLALLLRLRDEALQLPAGAVALSPVADLTFSGDSIHRNDGVDDMFSAEMMEPLVPVYLSQRSLRTHPHVSPVFGDYTGLPPLLLVVGSTELLLDDSVRVFHRAPNAQLLVWHGMPHVFPALDFLPQARAATSRIGHFMRDCFAGQAQPQLTDHAKAEVPVAATEEPVKVALPAAAPPQWSGRAMLYLSLTIVTGVLWMGALLVWPGPLVVLASPALWLTMAVVAVFMVMEAGAVGWRRLLSCLGANLWLGPACGLALFLFLRERSGHFTTAGLRPPPTLGAY
ncbi:MAG TPA: alpha/beta hydrolase fold domain-containing protein [Burkholderiaceae bacterium]|nr:alpha/beta hydrolase fold domain-containing protein [Burkholderiaceae bacterium]